MLPPIRMQRTHLSYVCTTGTGIQKTQKQPHKDSSYYAGLLVIHNVVYATSSIPPGFNVHDVSITYVCIVIIHARSNSSQTYEI